MLSRNGKLILIVIVVIFLLKDPVGLATLLQHAGQSLGTFLHTLGLGA